MDQLSAHVLTLPSCFTEVTVGAAHSLVTAFLITPSALSSLRASSTSGSRASAIERAFQNGGQQSPQGGSMLKYFSSCPDLQGKLWHVYSKLRPGLKWYLMFLTETRPGPAEWTPTILCRKEWVSHSSLHKLGVPYSGAPSIEQLFGKTS